MKKTFKLVDLDCANCAAKMEAAVQKIDGVTAASVSFMAQKMTIEGDDARFDEIVKEAVRVCKKVEPDCEILVKSNRTEGSFPSVPDSGGNRHDKKAEKNALPHPNQRRPLFAPLHRPRPGGGPSPALPHPLCCYRLGCTVEGGEEHPQRPGL